MAVFEFNYYNATPNPMRFSLASCKSEDTVDSAAVATPADASPLPPPSNVFSVINIVNDDPLPDLRGYQAVAASYIATTRQQVHQSTRMASPATPTVTTPPPVAQLISMPTTPLPPNTVAERDRPAYFDNTNSSAYSTDLNYSPSYSNSSTGSRKRKFWPKLKHLMIPSTAVVPDQQKCSTAKDRKLKHLFGTMTLRAVANRNEDTSTVNTNMLGDSGNWPRQRKSQVGPGR